MLNIIYSEILKLKKSNCMAMILTASFGMVILMNTAILVTGDKKRTLESYCSNIGLMNSLIIFSMFFCMIASYIFIREFNDKTASTIYSYPFPRIKIFFGKLVVVYMIIAVVYLLQSISAYFSYYKLFGTLNRDEVFLNIKVNFYSMLFQMSSIPMIIFLVNLKKNIILPIGYEILIMIINGVHDNRFILQIKYNPLIGAQSVFRYFYEEGSLEIRSMAIASLIFFIVSIFTCIYHFCKDDVH